MSELTRRLIDDINNNDLVSAEQSFADVMSDKVSTALADKKVEVAKNFVAPTATPQTTEEE
jgi:hypothetical protein